MMECSFQHGGRNPGGVDSEYDGFQEVGAMRWAGDRFWKSGGGLEEIPQ